MAKKQRRRRHERRRRHAEQQEGRGGLKLRHSVITGVGVAAGATLGLASPALGADYYVNSTADNGNGDCEDVSAGDCTLRDAIDDANNNAGYDRVFLTNVSGNIQLTGGEIPIGESTYIYGPGADQLTVTAQSNNRIFNIATVGGRVFLSYLTLAGNGTVSGDGGLIHNGDTELDIVASVLSGATATGRGGAIYDDGAYAFGYYNQLTYSTVSGNHAATGGGVYAYYISGFDFDDTFTGNGSTAGYGGALDTGTGYVFDSTVSGNSATVNSGGIFAVGNLYIYNDIIANNTAPVLPEIYANGGGAAFDLVENSAGITFSSPTVITGQDPQLGSLTNNGGATPTLKPGAGSPVVDQGNSYSYYDQRFEQPFLRTIDNPNKANASGGDGTDIGSIELTVAEGPQPKPATPAPAPATHKKKKCKKKKKRSAQLSKKKCKKKKKRSANTFSAPQAPVGQGRSRRAAGGARAGQRVRLGRTGAWLNGPNHRAFSLDGG